MASGDVWEPLQAPGRILGKTFSFHRIYIYIYTHIYIYIYASIDIQTLHTHRLIYTTTKTHTSCLHAIIWAVHSPFPLLCVCADVLFSSLVHVQTVGGGDECVHLMYIVHIYIHSHLCVYVLMFGSCVLSLYQQWEEEMSVHILCILCMYIYIYSHLYVYILIYGSSVCLCTNSGRRR
jgi:hypothetical protein